MQPSAMTSARLDSFMAERLARMALSSIGRDYPHKLDHVMTDDGDACTPRELHPSFHGSYDWHSCVHMHWTLARLLRRFLSLPAGADIGALFDRHFAQDALAAELAYLARPASASFERTYGWAWLLKLAAELHAAAAAGASDLRFRVDARFAPWFTAIDPVAKAFARRFVDFLPRAHYALRYGIHPNSAFGLALALDYGREVGDGALVDACTQRALEWFADDSDAPARFEPSGVDFLSPSLVEAELMRRLLDAAAFAEWLARFLPGFADASPHTLFKPAHVTDRTDAQLVHLDGLTLSRAWCFDGIASSLPPGDPRIRIAKQAANAHREAGAEGLDSGDFVGAHWLASFALLAFDGA
jgi:hypothetical protein